MQTLRCITIATDESRIHPALLRSADRFGYDLKVFGKGCQYKTNGSKIRIICDWMGDLTGRNGSDIMLYVDAYDCVFVRDSDKIIETYSTLVTNERTMICGAENNCFPKPEWSDRLGQTKHYPYPNSGTWIASVATAYHIFKRMADRKGVELIDDQLQFHNYIMSEPILDCRIVPDYKTKLFQTLYHAEQHLTYVPEKGTVRNHLTNSRPFVLHGNGSSDLSHAIRQLKL